MQLIRQKEWTEITYPGLSYAKQNRNLAPLNPVRPVWKGRFQHAHLPAANHGLADWLPNLEDHQPPGEHLPRWCRMFTGTSRFCILITISSLPYSWGKLTSGPRACFLFSTGSADAMSCLRHHSWEGLSLKVSGGADLSASVCFVVQNRTAVHDQQAQPRTEWPRRRGGGCPEWTLRGPSPWQRTVHREAGISQQVSPGSWRSTSRRLSCPGIPPTWPHGTQ